MEITLNFKQPAKQLAVVEYKDSEKDPYNIIANVYLVDSEEEARRLAVLIGDWDKFIPFVQTDDGLDTLNIVGPGRTR